MDIKVYMVCLSLLWAFSGTPLRAQEDSMRVVNLFPVYIFGDPGAQQKFSRYVQNVKKVYPLAREANRTICEMEDRLAAIENRASQRKYVKKMEDDLIRQYTPVLTRLTFQQGRILIKLIDRETQRTSYSIIRDMLGGVSAGIWQGIARLFGSNLKGEYDSTGEDRMLEDIVILLERGLI